MKKEFNWIIFIIKWIGVIIAAVALVGVTAYVTHEEAYKSFEGKYNIVEENKVSFNGDNMDKSLIAKFQKIQENISNEFYLDYNINSLIEGSIKGMVDGLGDSYTKYYTAAQYKERSEQLQGEYIGAGFSIYENILEEDYILISDVKDETPAAKAGIKAFDKIVAIDGKGLNEYEDSEYWDMFAEKDRKINLTLLREEENIEVELTVSKIVEQSIFSEMLTDKIGYIRIASFDAKASKDYEAKVDELLNAGMERLILDLRDNGGGLFSEMYKIANSILPDGSLVYKEINKAGDIKSKFADEKALNIPVVVLINGNTANAAEILASTIRDNDIAKLVGTKTYGKAISQATYMFSDGTALVMTVSQFYTKSDYDIQKEKGLNPDEGYAIESYDEYKNTNVQYIPKYNDVQLSKALEVLGG